jgi:hypothetical protein
MGVKVGAMAAEVADDGAGRRILVSLRFHKVPAMLQSRQLACAHAPGGRSSALHGRACLVCSPACT